MPASKRQAFPKSSRINKPFDFINLKQNGRRIQGRWLRLTVVRRSGSVRPRVAIAIRREVGDANERNRWRRRIREIFRRELLPRHQAKGQLALDYLVWVKAVGKCPKYLELKKELEYLQQKSWRAYA